MTQFYSRCARHAFTNCPPKGDRQFLGESPKRTQQIIVCCFATIQHPVDGHEDSLFWFFSTEGQLRNDAPPGTPIQFDGPMRLSHTISKDKTVRLYVSEPFLLRQYFNITPFAQPLSSGQPFQLVLVQSLPPQYSSAHSLTLTLQAQILPHSTGQDQMEMLLRVEKKELKIKLMGEDGHNVVEERQTDGTGQKHIQLRRDDKNCSIYKTDESIQQSRHISAKLFGPLSKHFNMTKEYLDNILTIYYRGSGCAPPIGKGQLHIFAIISNPFGSSDCEIWSLESAEDGEELPSGNGIHFVQKQFHVEFHPSQHSISPQLVLLANVEPQELSWDEQNANITILLEGNGANGTLDVQPETGLLSIKDSNGLMSMFKSENSLVLVALLLKNGSIVDRANITLEIGQAERKKLQKKRGEMIKFERSIYAFAIDPYNNIGGAKDQISIGQLGTKPSNKDGENLEFVVSEGGGGFFFFASSGNESGNTLIYNGPISQFARNYTLKVLLIADEFIDTAIVHILVAGIGSAAPEFPRPFQRILVTKYNSSLSAEGDGVDIFTLAAEDADPDAHLVYALEGTNCRDAEGREVPECTGAFSLSPNGTGQWVLSLIDNGAEELSEALVNISVRDEAHPLEAKSDTLVLLKFTQWQHLNGSDHPESNTNNNIAIINHSISPDHDLLLYLDDSMPVKSIIYSFGLPIIHPPTSLHYSLSGQRSKYFSIGRESGILSVALPLHNITGRYPLTINALINGTQQMHYPITLEIGSSTTKWPEFAQNFYEIELDEGGRVMEEATLGAEFADLTTFGMFPSSFINGSVLNVDGNGTLHFATAFPPNMTIAGSHLFLFAENQAGRSTIVPIHFDMPSTMAPTTYLPIPISPFPSSPIQLPEHSPIGTYVLSLDFANSPQLSHFQLRPLSNRNSLSISIEKRANSLLFRTNQTLRGMAAEEEDGPLQFALLGNGTEIGRFSVHILSSATCQAHFKMDQKLILHVAEESLLQLEDSNQWLPIGTVSAELEPNARGCEPIRYELASMLYGQLSTFGEGRQIPPAAPFPIRVDPHTGIISTNSALLNNTSSAAVGEEHLSLIVSAQSDPKFSTRIRLQLQIRRPPPQKPFRFVGPSPLLLEIEEGIPANTLLTTLRANARGDEMVKYRLEGPDTDLLGIGAENGQLKTLHGLDFEALGDRHLPLRMLAIAELEGGEKAEMEIQLGLIDINDNDPTFGRLSYDFVMEKDAPIGRVLGKVEAEDADQCTRHVHVHLLDCTFQFNRFSRQIVPINRTIQLDSTTGVLSLASPVDDSPGGHFTLHLEAQDDGGRRSRENGTVQVWIVDNSDILSILVHKSPVELDAGQLSEYLELIAAKTALRPLLYEVRYRIDPDGEPIRHSSVLQMIFLNGTRILAFEEAELALRDMDLGELDGFEQNLFLPASKGSALAAANSPVSQSAHLLPLSLLFLFLLATILSVLGVLICQHRRRYIAKRHLAKSIQAIRQASISKFDSLDKRAHPIGPPTADFLLPPPADFWKRPLPPPPIFPPFPPPLHHHPTTIQQQQIGTDSSFYAHSQQNSDYYTVQEMKIAL